MQDILSNTIDNYVDHAYSRIHNRNEIRNYIFEKLDAVFPPDHSDRNLVGHLLFHDFHRVLELISIGQNPAGYLELHNVMTCIMNRLRLNGEYCYKYTDNEQEQVELDELSSEFYQKDVLSLSDNEYIQYLDNLHSAMVRKDIDILHHMMGGYTDYGSWIDSIKFTDARLMEDLVHAIIISIKLIQSNGDADPLYCMLFDSSE